MKKGYKRLLLFELFIFIILIVNSFFFDLLSKYKLVIFFIVIIPLLWRICGIEKDRHRFTKDILLETIIFLFAFFIIFYLLGLVIGFTRLGNYYTGTGFINYLLPTFIIVILKEFFRYNVICKSEGSKITTIISIILFIFIDVTQSIRISSFATGFDIFNFIAITLLPAISTNIALSYIVSKVGYKPTILYSEVIRLYRYLLPLIPNPSPYIYSIIMLVLPIILAFRINKFYDKMKDSELNSRNNKRKLKGLIILLIPVIFLIYLVSGYFRFHAIVIASGSMSPVIYKGDIVVIDKENINYDELKEGTVIAFYHDNKIIVHRLVKKFKYDNNEYLLYTKGDNNEFVDDFIYPKDVYGIVKFKIPYIGLPTVWLHNL